MKSQFQTLSFLANYTPKTELDKEFINSFLVQRFQITPKTLINAPQSHDNPLDVSMFIQWFESGLEALKIARFRNQVVLLGNTTLSEVKIIAKLTENDSIEVCDLSAFPSDIQAASDSEKDSFRATMVANNLQPDPNSLSIVPKYIPKEGDRVVFYDWELDVQGVGVVRDVTANGDVIFFCYFIYPTYSQQKRIGFNLRENPGVNLKTFCLENIDKENISSTLGNSTSCFRRMGRELEKVGKVWKDKLLRIEPIQVEQEKGGKYFYISDKLKVVSDIDKGTPTSHLRYLAGNYFTDHAAASKMLDKFTELLEDYLASEKWPEVE